MATFTPDDWLRIIVGAIASWYGIRLVFMCIVALLGRVEYTINVNVNLTHKNETP